MRGSQAMAQKGQTHAASRATPSASQLPALPPGLHARTASRSSSPLGSDVFHRSVAAPSLGVGATLASAPVAQSSGQTCGGASTLPAAVPALGEMNYYQQRIADFKRRHPDLPVPSYYTQYASKYIDRFTYDIGPQLSPAGQAWVARARKNLQVAIEKKRAADPAAFDRLECNDAAFLKFAYSTHPAAYLDAGLAKLPMSDLIKIGAGPDIKDLLSPAGLEQVEVTAVQVAESKADDFGAEIARDGRQLVASAEGAW